MHFDRVLGLLLCTFVLVAPLLGQEWSAQQKEVWASEMAYWKAFSDRNVDQTVAYFHEDYQGWTYGDTLPGGKTFAKAAFLHSFPVTQVFYHHATPISILVRGNVAVVHYVVAAHFSDESSEHISGEQRWTDTLVKEDGRWLLLGDHGGPTSALGN